MKLYIGNKNYSSWSLRAWLVITQAGIPFEEIRMFMDMTPGSQFRKQVLALSEHVAGKVPVLITDDGLAVWDSLAICEYVADAFPASRLWPSELGSRARARSFCAEMHSSFMALRNHLPMNIEASLPDVGLRVMNEMPDVAADVVRIDKMWRSQLADSGGPFLFGDFTIADAFFAPVCTRFRTYAIPLSEISADYADRLLGLPGMQAWTWEAIREEHFIKEDEPYRDGR